MLTLMLPEIKPMNSLQLWYLQLNLHRPDNLAAISSPRCPEIGNRYFSQPPNSDHLSNTGKGVVKIGNNRRLRKN